MRKLVITIPLLLALGASFMLAQAPQQTPQPPDPATRVQRHVKMLTTILSLTSAQQQQATTIFTNAESSASSLHQQMRTERHNLNAAVKSNNTGAIDQIASTIGSLTAQMTSTQAKAHAAFYQILTPDQQQKVTELESEHPGGFPGTHPFGH